MALISCPHCGNSVSSKAPHCPRCGAPIAAQQYRQPMEPEPKKNSSFLPWLLVGILAAILIGVGVIFLISNSNKKERKTDQTAWRQSDDAVSWLSVPEMEVTPDDTVKDDAVNKNRAVIPQPSLRTDEAKTPEPRPIYDGHDMGFDSRKHHHLVGYMTDNLGDHAIELDFNCNNGQVSDVVYKNVKYGGKIHMRCTDFSFNSISLLGKDGSKKFTMDLNYDDNGNFTGDAMVGDKYLSVTLNTSCSHN